MKRKKKPMMREPQEFEQRVIQISRVTRVMKGGKRMSFRACLAIGDKKGRVGVGIAKGKDVTLAIQKAFTKAKKNLVTVPMVDGTIPHAVRFKFKSAELLLKPAKQGSGIKAGGAVRQIYELAGIQNISGKILGSNNKINNVKAALLALDSFKAEAVAAAQKSDKKPVKKEEKKTDKKETGKKPSKKSEKKAEKETK